MISNTYQIKGLRIFHCSESQRRWKEVNWATVTCTYKTNRIGEWLGEGAPNGYILWHDECAVKIPLTYSSTLTNPDGWQQEVFSLLLPTPIHDQPLLHLDPHVIFSKRPNILPPVPNTCIKVVWMRLLLSHSRWSLIHVMSITSDGEFKRLRFRFKCLFCRMHSHKTYRINNSGDTQWAKGSRSFDARTHIRTH